MKPNHKYQAFALLAGGLLMVNATNLIRAAEPLSVEERLSQLENNLQSLQKENAELKSQLGWDGKAPLVVAKPGGKEKNLKVGGYLQANFESGDAPDARFTGIEDRALIRRARINVSGAFKEDFDFKIEGDFGANSIAETTGYRAQISDVFINWNKYSFANVKVGQFKTPFGYEQLLADTKSLTVERSLPNDRLTDNRQIGLGVSGDIIAKRLSYSVGAFNGSGVNNSFNDNESFMWAGRLNGVAFDGKVADRETRVAVGINALTTRDKSISKAGFGFDAPAAPAADNLFFGRRASYGIDAQVKWWLFGLEAEYLLSHFEPANRVPFDDLDAEGWYVTATAEVWPKRLQALVKYETFDPNRDVAGNSSDVLTFGLNYFFKGDDLKLSVNYLLGNAAGARDHQGRLLTRMQLIF